MDKANKIMRSEMKESQAIKPCIGERAEQVLKATARLQRFELSDIHADGLRGLVAIVENSKCTQENSFSITREPATHAAANERSRLIYDEVMKW